MLQVHFSGGEPTVRRDLVDLVRHAAQQGLYGNLITSGVQLDAAKLAALADAGLDHVQLSFQDADATQADRLGGYRAGHAKKLVVARLIREAGLPLTANFVVHRQNLDRLPEMLALGCDLGASRIEVAHVQYYGWALENRTALMPSRTQLEQANAAVAQARQDLRGRVTVDYVVPDYYAARPKPCMGGWARRVMNITPSGLALPCHAAETLPGFEFPSVRAMSLGDIWRSSTAFARFRGTDWMPEPCRTCEQREVDWGGCRCQAFAITGDAAATDPACALSPHHGLMAAAIAKADDAGDGPPPGLVYRRIRTAANVT